jgi:hypothetical protein
MTTVTAEFTTVLDQIISAAFDLACAMPEAHNALHEVAGLAAEAQQRIEAELEAMHFAEMAARYETCSTRKADAISAGWGWD